MIGKRSEVGAKLVFSSVKPGNAGRREDKKALPVEGSRWYMEDARLRCWFVKLRRLTTARCAMLFLTRRRRFELEG